MQAIISDIIVNQAAQNGNLQISQLTQNNSSSQTSFMEMLNSLRKQEAEIPEKETEIKTAYEDKKPVEVSDTEKDQKNESVKKSEEPKTNGETKQNTEQKSVQKTDSNTAQKEGNVKKVSLQKDDVSKPKLLKNERLELPETNNEIKADNSKKVQNQSTAKDLKKVIDDKNLNINANEEENAASELTETVAVVQNASLLNSEKSEINVETKVSDDETLAEIDTESVSFSENNILQNKLPSDEKIYALDKDSKIIVHDQRTEFKEEIKPAEKNNSKTQNQLQVKYDSNNNATITMELSEQSASENILSLDNQTAAADGSNFQAMLSNQIQANAPEFVKAGSVVLQDNNKGTINLVLHPDDLGNVKIHLSMDGKTVSAHITVNTKEALEVFKDNAQTLREAFAKNGFETSNFDVSYNGSSNNQNQNFEGRYDGTEYWARNAYNDSLGGEKDGHIQEAYEYFTNSEYSINIVA